jgi:hypothetical protein
MKSRSSGRKAVIDSRLRLLMLTALQMSVPQLDKFTYKIALSSPAHFTRSIPTRVGMFAISLAKYISKYHGFLCKTIHFHINS